MQTATEAHSLHCSKMNTKEHSNGNLFCHKYKAIMLQINPTTHGHVRILVEEVSEAWICQAVREGLFVGIAE